MCMCHALSGSSRHDGLAGAGAGTGLGWALGRAQARKHTRTHEMGPCCKIANSHATVGSVSTCVNFPMNIECKPWGEINKIYCAISNSLIEPAGAGVSSAYA